jgi:hypothetical protein
MGISRMIPCHCDLQPISRKQIPSVSEEQSGLYSHIFLLPCGWQMCEERPKWWVHAVIIIEKQNTEADVDWM